MNRETELAMEKLAADFKAIVADAEELLHVTAGQGGGKAGGGPGGVLQGGAFGQGRIRRSRGRGAAQGPLRSVGNGQLCTHPPLDRGRDCRRSWNADRD